MKLSFITPTAYIKEYQGQGDFVLALAHLMERHEANEYEKAILSTNLPIILDNGLFENGHPEGIDSLIEKAVRIKAELFFAPDYLYNAKRTLDGVKNTLHILKQMKIDMKIGVVVQGETEEEWFSLYDEFQKIPEVSLIGLSILAIPRCFGKWNKEKHEKGEKYSLDESEIVSTRIDCLKKLKERNNNIKDCHLLGLGDSYHDVLYAKQNCPFVVSNDTSSPFWNGIQGKSLTGKACNVEGGKTKVKVDFNYKDATKEQLDLAQSNINQVKKSIL